MTLRTLCITGGLLLLGAPMNMQAEADVPAGPALAAAPAKQVIILPTTLRIAEIAHRAHGPRVAVCTTFPGTIYVDDAGNVYKQPAEIDAHGRERAVGVPIPLQASKPVDLTKTPATL